MALGRRRSERQEIFWIAAAETATEDRDRAAACVL